MCSRRLRAATSPCGAATRPNFNSALTAYYQARDRVPERSHAAAAPASASDLCHTVKEGEQAIEYFTTGDEVSAFVASREKVSVVCAIASKREIEQQLAALRFQLEKFTYGAEYVDAHFWQLKEAADRCLSKLYDAIFAPLE